MKKILFMAVSAVLLAAGCQETEIKNEVSTPIGFGTHMGKLTKEPNAENAGLYDNLMEQGFRVFGRFATDLDLNYDLYEDYFDDVIKVKATSKQPTTQEGNWYTDDIYYWPGQGKELDLYAISFWEDATHTIGAVEVTPESRTLTYTNFVVDADADNDLMVAAMIRQDQDDDKYVRPYFQHALTKVLLKFKASGDNIYIVSAKTSDIPSTSTLTATNTDPQEPEKGGAKVSVMELTWGEKTVPLSYEAQYHTDYPENVAEVSGVIGAPNSETTLDAVKLSGTAITYGSWLLLPQDDISGYKLDIVYLVDGMYIPQTLDLKQGNLTKWEKNQQITYNVTISPDYITFEPDVQDWPSDSPSHDSPSHDENLVN